MQQLNRIELRGIVGSVRETQVDNHFIIHMTVATNCLHKAKDGSAVIETTWHQVDMPSDTPLGITKGDGVHVTGRLKKQPYIRENGTTVSDTYIVASNIETIDEPLEMEQL